MNDEKIMPNPQFPYEETLKYIKLAQSGDREAMNELVERNMALVRSIVKKYLNRGTEYDDLYQIGSMGLVKAIKNFDSSYGVRFSTYAVPMIAGEIKRFLRDDGMIKVSRTLKELAAKVCAAQRELGTALGRDPGVQEIAEYIGETPEDIALALDASRPHVSIYEPVYGDEGEALVMDRITAEEDGTDTALDRVLLQQLMEILDSREKKIVVMRYFRDKTQSEIAAYLGISQVQVSRLENRIMEKLREQYEKEVIPALMKKFEYKSVMQVPKLDKIVINIGLGDIKDNPKSLENAVNDLTQITGQKPMITKAKKSIAAFKLREGANIGCKVTLRSGKMYDFAYKLFNVALPRVRDFRGVSENSFDGRGNYSMGIKEQLIFPEIEYDKVDKLRGMDIIFVTTAETDEEAKELLKLLGMPFKN